MYLFKFLYLSVPWMQYAPLKYNLNYNDRSPWKCDLKSFLSNYYYYSWLNMHESEWVQVLFIKDFIKLHQDFVNVAWSDLIGNNPPSSKPDSNGAESWLVHSCSWHHLFPYPPFPLQTSGKNVTRIEKSHTWNNDLITDSKRLMEKTGFQSL